MVPRGTIPSIRAISLLYEEIYKFGTIDCAYVHHCTLKKQKEKQIMTFEP